EPERRPYKSRTGKDRRAAIASDTCQASAVYPADAGQRTELDRQREGPADQSADGLQDDDQGGEGSRASSRLHAAWPPQGHVAAPRRQWRNQQDDNGRHRTPDFRAG